METLGTVVYSTVKKCLWNCVLYVFTITRMYSQLSRDKMLEHLYSFVPLRVSLSRYTTQIAIRKERERRERERGRERNIKTEKEERETE